MYFRGCPEEGYTNRARQVLQVQDSGIEPAKHGGGDSPCLWGLERVHGEMMSVLCLEENVVGTKGLGGIRQSGSWSKHMNNVSRVNRGLLTRARTQCRDTTENSAVLQQTSEP